MNEPHNPYSPPAAAVADAEAPARGEPPFAVKLASKLLWLGLGIAVLTQLLVLPELQRNPFFVPTVIGMVVSLAVNAWLFFKIGQGRNWARIVYLVLILISSPVLFISVKAIFARSTFEGVAVAAELAANVIALYLVFVPGRAWYRKSAPA